MCLIPSIVAICLICHKAWSGRRWYAAETSDLNIVRAVVGCACRYRTSAVARSEIESIRAPTTSSHAIMEFNENLPALWSLINLSLSDRGLGAEWMGVLYIPGNKSVPKPSEYLPASSSISL